MIPKQKDSVKENGSRLPSAKRAKQNNSVKENGSSGLSAKQKNSVKENGSSGPSAKSTKQREGRANALTKIATFAMNIAIRAQSADG